MDRIEDPHRTGRTADGVGGARLTTSPCGLAHVGLTTADLDRLGRFYTDIVGLEVRRVESPTGAPFTQVATLGIGALDMLIIYEVPDFVPGSPVPASRRVGGFDHLAFRIGTETELAGVVDRLAAAGHRTRSAVHGPSPTSVALTDPDGTALTLCTPQTTPTKGETDED